MPWLKTVWKSGINCENPRVAAQIVLAEIRAIGKKVVGPGVSLTSFTA